jgi:hypothetical protein
MTLYVPPASSGMASFHEAAALVAGITIDVPVAPLDTLVAATPIPGSLVMKLDVEGHERAALDGARRTIELHRPLLLIEINPRTQAASGSSSAELMDYLVALGYKYFSVIGNGTRELSRDELPHDRFVNLIARLP